MQEIKGEKKYGINTTGANELKKLQANGIDISHATIYMPVSYALLENIFLQLTTTPKKHFVDIGCGKGRALCVAAFHQYHTITGIDFSEALCKDAAHNLTLIKNSIPACKYSIQTMNAMDYQFPEDADCIFFFNPFDDIVMQKVIVNILKSIKLKPRSVDVVYVNPLYKDLFLQNGFKEKYYSKKRTYFEVSILNFRY
jgi:SAM-dependent methyltransferase